MIVVTGQNGLLGKQCIERLRRQNEVIGLSREARLPSASGFIDILVNCAGYVSFGKISDTTEEEANKLIDANLKFAWQITKDFISQKGKHIIHIGSTRSISVAPEKALYSATKHALLALNRSVNIDYENIHSSIICPGSFNEDTVKDVIDTIEFVIEHPTIQEVILNGQI